ncbi:MAG: hypothetical protein JOZ43_07520 [Acidobacteriales bacterium]|nr:hypothetical protein [Terriglobales bacterium]
MGFHIDSDVFLTANISRENVHIRILPESAGACPEFLPAGTSGKVVANDKKGITVRFRLPLDGETLEIVARLKHAIIGSVLDVDRRAGERKGKDARRFVRKQVAEPQSVSLFSKLSRLFGGSTSNGVTESVAQDSEDPLPVK